MMRLPSWISQHLAAVRTLVVMTVLLGVLYPLLMTGVAQIPGLRSNADGSLITDASGKVVGSSLIGQSFTDTDGNAVAKYFQSRPSAAGAGYDPNATSASNLGPESVVDTLGDPALKDSPDGDGSKQALLTQVCARSKAAGELEGVDGSRPYCTKDGVGAVLGVFYDKGLTGKVTRVVSLNETGTPFVATYSGVTVEPAKFGDDYSKAVITPIRGDAPAESAVPADAVTASASGLDPDISPAYAKLQTARVAKARGITDDQVRALIDKFTTGRAIGFLGEPAVNVLELNLELDRVYPAKS